MKIILTGSTGYIGGEILRECLSNALVTSVVVLSRRDLNITDPKLRLILHDDYTRYSAELLSELAGAEACIYCLGTNIPIKPAHMNRKINFDYAQQTAKIFAEGLTDRSPTKEFRFVYLSGALPEKDPDKKLWFLAENRRMRGELENALLSLNKAQSASGFRVFIARPGFVQKQGAKLQTWLIGKVANAIMIHHLAACMLQVALEGHSEPLLENATLNEIGERATTSGLST